MAAGRSSTILHDELLVDLGQRQDEPSRWNTLRALRVLRWAEAQSAHEQSPGREHRVGLTASPRGAMKHGGHTGSKPSPSRSPTWTGPRDFYVQAGWNLDVDTEPAPGMRVVQLTPPGSGCSITFGIGFPQSEPGSYVNTYLVVSDIEAAHRDLTERRVPVTDIFHWTEQGQTPRSRSQSRRLRLVRHLRRSGRQCLAVQEVPSRK